MKTIGLLIFMLSIISCRNDHKKNESHAEVLLYDTIVIDYNVENEKRKQRESLYEELRVVEIIDSLKSFAEIQGIMEINEDGLPFGNPEIVYKYYVNNIPSSIYKMIFSDEIIQIDKIRYTNEEVDEKEKKVIIQKGPKITENRKFKNLLSVTEKDEYLQLLLTKEGKYVPEVVLVTVSRSDLSQIDNLNLYGGIYDSYDINYWHSRFSNGHDELVVTKVENTKFDAIELDTTMTEYKISHEGMILKN